MVEANDFPGAVLSALREAEVAIHNGDAAPRIALWSHTDPVTVFGAARTAVGWAEVRDLFDWLASRFSRCDAYDIDVIAASAGADVAYLLTHEHTTAVIGKGEPETYALRVTWVFRREGGKWKAAHRHADPIAGGEEAIGRLGEPTGM